MLLPDPATKPVLMVEEVAELLRCGRRQAYTEANLYLATDGAKGIPAIRVGRSIRCPTAAVLRKLGIDAEPHNETTPTPASAGVVMSLDRRQADREDFDDAP